MRYKQTNKKDRTTEKELNETEINNLLDKEFKVWSLRCSLNLREEWMSSVRTSTKRYKNIKRIRVEEYNY